jgi:zinc protease
LFPRLKPIEEFLDEISRLRTTLPKESEVRDVQRYLTGSFVFSLQRNTSLLRYAIRAKRFGLGFDYLHRYPGLITAVTRQDVRRVAGEHLHADKVVVVSAGATEV